MNDISLKQLEVFVAVVEYGGFTRAAEELFFNQSTISAHISLLEQALGQELLVRGSRRSVRLTDAGERVYPIAKQVLSGCDALRALFADSRPAAGTVALGASTMPGQYLLPVDSLFASLPALTLTPNQETRCRNGNPFTRNVPDGRYRCYGKSGEFLMLGSVRDNVMSTVKSFFEV